MMTTTRADPGRFGPGIEGVLLTLPPWEVGGPEPGLYWPAEPFAVVIRWEPDDAGTYTVVVAGRGPGPFLRDVAFGIGAVGAKAGIPRIGRRRRDYVIFERVPPGQYRLLTRPVAVENMKIGARTPMVFAAEGEFRPEPAAARELSRRGLPAKPRDTIDALLAALATEQDRSARGTIAEALGQAGAGEARVIDALLAALAAEEDNGVRR